MDYKEPTIRQMHANVEALVEHYSNFIAKQTGVKPLDVYQEIKEIAERIEDERKG
ncbi:MAG: hypothetical protein N4A74_06860 [Carboxylicivirga sp.]|jgi:hypothetical protein|nr:hypothetical protein [Carboxylicivirga sp.]